MCPFGDAIQLVRQLRNHVDYRSPAEITDLSLAAELEQVMKLEKQQLKAGWFWPEIRMFATIAGLLGLFLVACFGSSALQEAYAEQTVEEVTISQAEARYDRLYRSGHAYGQLSFQELPEAEVKWPQAVEHGAEPGTIQLKPEFLPGKKIWARIWTLDGKTIRIEQE